MKHLIKVVNLTLFTIAIISALSSCYPATQIGIPLERQKENIYYIPSTPVSTTLLETNDINFNLLRSSADKLLHLNCRELTCQPKT
jgi:hypothetical protein